MKRYLVPLSLALAVQPALSATACPWAGGSYSFRESGVYGELSVNGNCTEMRWKRLKEPEITTLKRTRAGWKGKLKRVDVELLENGRSLRIFDTGVMRQVSVKPMG